MRYFVFFTLETPGAGSGYGNAILDCDEPVTSTKLDEWELLLTKDYGAGVRACIASLSPLGAYPEKEVSEC